jgi:hypothetical protein
MHPRNIATVMMIMCILTGRVDPFTRLTADLFLDTTFPPYL